MKDSTSFFPKIMCLYMYIWLIHSSHTASAQCIPNTRATYDISLSGSTSNGGNFSRTGRMIVDPRITAAGGVNLNNGPNDREVGIVSGFPAGTPEPGAIWFFTNTAMCRPLGTGCNSTPVNAALDVVFTSISANKLTIRLDGTVYGNAGAGNVLTANLLNNFSARGGITASLYQIISGTIELTFSNNGRTVSGTIDITGTSGLGGVGTSSYFANVSGTCASGATCACSTAPALPNLTQQTGNITASGSNVNYDLSIVNNGTANSANFKVTYYIATSKTSDAKFFNIGEDQVLSLAPSGSTVLRRNINACRAASIRSGGYYFGYVIDLIDDIKESNEEDNIFETTTLQTLTCPVSAVRELAELSVSTAPNPAQTHIVLTAEFPKTMVVDIHNVQGVRVYSGTFQNVDSSLTLDISSFSSGLYVLNITGAAVRHTSKFVKQY
jgi:CARDB/Secretion system C-terminal sorting domain